MTVDPPGVVPGPHPGLCAVCVHHRETHNRRGSTFHMCERSRDDPRFRKYPPLPVLRCPGFGAREE